MLKKLAACVLTALIMCGFGVIASAAENGVEINEENFPDKKFREWYVVWCDTDGDGYLSDEEIANAINCNFADEGDGIETVKGIEYFTELRLFYFQYGDMITEVDLSKNTKLEDVAFTECYSIEKIILGNHPDLQSFSCKGTKITEIDLTASSKLSYLDVSATNITELDISGNPELKKIYAQWNDLTELDISNNEYLLKAYTEPTYISDWGENTVMYCWVPEGEEEWNPEYVLCVDDKVKIITGNDESEDDNTSDNNTSNDNQADDNTSDNNVNVSDVNSNTVESNSANDGNPKTGATAGLTFAGIALVGAAVVAAKKKK